MISVTMYTDTRKAGMSDDLTQSIHYGEVSHFIKKFMEEHTFKLIETVAEKLAAELLKAFPLMQKLDLEIKKPYAILLKFLLTRYQEAERQEPTAF